MITALRLKPQFDVKACLVKMLVVGVASTASLLGGIVPSLQSSSLVPVFSNAAYAQSVSDQEVQNYARSVLAIEPIRLSAYNQIKQITGSDNVPAIACHRPSSLSDLPDNIRNIAVDYCNQAIAIVESNSLTITRFNEITVAHQSDPSLSSRIQQALMQMQ